MVLWSIDEHLQNEIAKLNLPTRLIFWFLKSHLKSTSHVASDIGTELIRTLPENPHQDTQEQTNKSEANDKTKTSVLENNQPLDQSPSAFSSQVGLLNLPDEVKTKIVKYVRLLSQSELRGVMARRTKHLTHDSEGYSRACVVYQLGRPPLLTTLQSLASVNRSLYKICLPVLWKRVRLPSKLPVHFSLWTKDILYKHGHLVQSISILLANEWTEEEPGEEGLDDVDNVLLIDDYNHDLNEEPDDRYTKPKLRGLSPQNMIKVLVMCPNIKSLEIRYPLLEVHPVFLHIHLHKIFLHLTTLQHLTLDRSMGPRSTDNFVTHLIRLCPLLESLACGYLCRSTPIQPPPQYSEPPFEWHLSQLKHLSKLELKTSSNVDRTWSDQTWNQKLTTLKFEDCTKLSIPDAHYLISRIAPDLLDLILHASIPGSDTVGPNIAGSVAFGFQWASDNRFTIPKLARLSLYNPTQYELLISFQDCKELRELKYINLPANEWNSVEALICASTWPKLKILNLQQPQEFSIWSWETREKLVKLRKYCELKKIEFLYDDY
ncbi:hypothetical protein CROQUDRAFT_44731 [Cronartium quercuum f. sp. fusiforme G11]|uniref:Uncharacterized protein n=1 Tax=Cronartium quercuum f. sp. fusiforme G11 TaxID=708437 RepID=A0A9P6NHU5_9BASI|nr:hypothetical protein CROQUDRAFT_44731 [Cronartium quercuum f. sp. fusiforme G11]